MRYLKALFTLEGKLKAILKSAEKNKKKKKIEVTKYSLKLLWDAIPQGIIHFRGQTKTILRSAKKIKVSKIFEVTLGYFAQRY